MPTRSQIVATEVSVMLRARTPLLWIVTREEARVEAILFEAARAAGYVARMWDCAQGVTNLDGKLARGVGSSDVDDMLDYIMVAATAEGSDRTAWVMRDMSPWLEGVIGIRTCRRLRNVARALVTAPSGQAVIVISTKPNVPPELTDHATVIEWPMPDREEISAILDKAVEGLPDAIRATAVNGSREDIIDAAVGLSAEEVSSLFGQSLMKLRKIDPLLVGQQKRRIIARDGLLRWYDPLPGGLNAVGGLDVLKDWLVSRREAFSPEARAYGLPAPRGALLVGVPGCGKSLTAKAIATAWGVPLLQLDLNGLKSKFVGESEGNLRRVLRTVESVGRCVLWVDEIEKAMAGATDGAADGGVSSDALGTFLSWMQERPPGSFVIATANDVSKLPPELMRKGRFDQVWFVDLPTRTERADILLTALGHLADIDATKVAEVCAGYTGAEIAEGVVVDAKYLAFADGERDVTTQDLVTAAQAIVPLSKTAKEKLARLREWASEGRARYATTPDVVKETNKFRGMDFDN